MNLRAIIASILFLVTCFSGIDAQERSGKQPLIRGHRPLSAHFNKPVVFQREHGFTLKSTDAITKDDQGFLWIGGRGGLLRFDGQAFKKIPLCIEGNELEWVRHLWFDRAERKLWIATWGYGLLQLDLQTYACKIVPVGEERGDQYIYWLHSEPGALWMGKPKGLSVWYAHNDSIQHFNYTAGAKEMDQVQVERANKFYSYYKDGLNDSLIWLGSIYGLLRFNRISHQFEHYYYDDVPDELRKSTNSIRTVCQLPDGDLLLGTWGGGIVRFRPGSQSFSQIGQKSKVKAFNNIVHFSPTTSQKLWVTSKGGIQELDLNTEEWGQKLKNDIGERKVYGCQYIDEAGRIFIGEGGLFAFYDPLLQQFTHYDLPPELSVDPLVEVKAILKQQGQDVLWLAVYGGRGVCRYEEARDSWSVLPVAASPEPETFYALAYSQLRNGDHLMLANSADYYRVDPNRLRVSSFPLSSKKDLTVGSFMEHSDGSYWFSTSNSGLIIHQGDTRRQYLDELVSPLVGDHQSSLGAMVEDSLGNVWISSITGYSVYDNRQDTFYNFPYALQDTATAVDFSVILRDSTGQIWLVSYLYGLMRVSPEHPDRGIDYIFDQTHGKNIQQACVGHRGFIWLRTELGLERFDPRTAQCWLIENSYGLPGNIKEMGSLADGRIYLGYQGGFTLFHPDSLQLNTTLASPYLTDFAVFDQPISTSAPLHNTEAVELEPQDNFFSIAFSAIHFSLPRQDAFAYQLEGVDPDWVYTKDRRRVFYTRVPSGHYTFKVKAANNEGRWTPEAVTLDIRIATPWWKTGLAVTAYAVFGILLLYGLYRFQLSRKLALAESERLREMHAWKSDVYANITHEFRTPLTVILGMADWVHTSIDNGQRTKAMRAIDMIKSNGRRLLKLVNEMLDLAKLEHGSLDLQTVQIDVIPFVKYLCESFQSLAHNKQLDFSVHSSIESLLMDVDQDKLAVIVSNLLSNAVKFTPPQGKVTVELQQHEEKGQLFFQLAVTDTGPGLSEAEQEAVFGRFYQADTAGAAVQSGSGLGLPLSKELVTLMGGNIKLSSQPNQGSVFRVRLPISRQAPFAVSAVPGEMGALDASGRIPASDEQPTVLIVEDNADVATYVQSCLYDRYAILYAPDGKKGLALAIDRIPDMIISDVVMPGMDGFALCAKLKRDERTNHIPIVLLTARATQMDKITGIRQGADAYLTKPFAKEELLARLHQLMDLRATLQQKYSTGLIGAKPTSSDEHPLGQFVRKAEQLVLKHMADEAFSGSSLARSLHLSESQTYRKIKALTGMSTAIFIRHVRLQKAKVLLRDPTLQVSEVAYLTGFKSAVYFSQVFKETFGQSPSAFRDKADQ